MDQSAQPSPYLGRGRDLVMQSQGWSPSSREKRKATPEVRQVCGVELGLDWKKPVTMAKPSLGTSRKKQPDVGGVWAPSRGSL